VPEGPKKNQIEKKKSKKSQLKKIYFLKSAKRMGSISNKILLMPIELPTFVKKKKKESRGYSSCYADLSEFKKVQNCKRAK